MPSFNKIIVMGNLVRDPEKKTLAGGTTVCTITVAATHTYHDANKQKKEEVCFIDVKAFGKTAENIAKFFSKGKPILVDGRIKQENWDDKTTGQKRSKHVIMMDSFAFVASGGSDSQPSSQASNTPPPQPEEDAGESDDVDDDLPF